MTSSVEVHGLTKDFGGTRALDGVTFAVAAGEIFGLLGPNGAGKTTTMRILLTLLKPTEGRALVAGHDVAEHPVAVRAHVGWVPQERAVDPLLTVMENMTFMGGLYHLAPAVARHRATDLLELAGLAGHRDTVATNLSGGMRRKLELAMSLVNVPAVLFLDEPTVGLDVTARRNLWAYVRQIRANGTTIVLTTHYLEEADALCDRVAIIDRGRIRATGAPDRLKSNYQVGSLDEVYLAATGQELAA
ncbi:MAG TPA: ATP-binding cassette domain-containing protein [Streptosporangiaceae bacterium]